MNMQDLADALASKNLERYSAWFADDMKLYVPVYEEPFAGKEAACEVLSVVFSFFDNFHYVDVFAGRSTHALVFRADVHGIPLEGVDYVKTNENDLVTEFSVTMRPLKAITTLTEVIAAKMQENA